MNAPDTVARRAVRDATAVLRSLPFEDPRAEPPFELIVERAPEIGEMTVPYSTALSSKQTSAPPALTDLPTVCGALELLAAGATTTRALVEAALDAAERHAALGAVVAIDADAALAEADVLDAERSAGRIRGALHGVPITVKDVIDVAGLPTRAGSAAYDETPITDADAVARVREAGALLLAKVATHEFALGVATPQCANPHDPSRISGGSSGGSAIAVATGIGLASIGTDTRASLRVPSALCGTVGFKATFAAVPATGIVPLSWTIDHVGPITRDAADAGILLEVMSGVPPRGTLPRRLVIGIATKVLEDADAPVADACASALLALERAGCVLVEIDAPGLAELELANDLGLIISRSEAATYHRGRGTDLARCIAEVREQLDAAAQICAVDYLDAQRQRRLLAARALAAFAHCDLVAAPTTPILAPPREDYERYLLRLSRNTILWSLAGAPAASFPCGGSSEGLPVGLQLAARPFEEAVLLAAGVTLEAALETRR